jgi:hypothetical protein
MIRTLTLFLLYVTVTSAPAQKLILHNVHFAYDDYEMTDALRDQLDSLYDKAPLGATINLGIVGPIKSHASRSYSNTISSRRAAQVKAYLTGRGLKDANIRILTVPYGRNRLTTGTDKKKKNTIQLYEIEWLKPKDEWITLMRPDTNCIPRKKPQKFAVYQHSGNTITGESGTIITFPDNTFEFPEGGNMDCDIVVIELIECLDLGEAITQGLSTRSGIRMLTTGGMVYLMAYCNGKELTIKKNKSIEIKIPTYNKQAGMELFRGVYSKNGPDWVNTGQKDNSDTLKKLPPTGNINYSDNPELIPRPDSYSPERIYDGIYVKETRDDSITRTLDYYVFELNKLGWINCDKFYENPKKTNIVVNADTAIHPLVRMIFKDISCVMPGDFDGKKYSFSNIPWDYSVVIVAFAERNKKLYLGMKQTVTKKNGNETIELEEVTQAEFREKMKLLNTQ